MSNGPGPDGSIDLGGGVYMRWLRFAPDRDLNPQYSHLPDNDRTGIILGHVHPDGAVCEGAVLFDTPENHRGVNPDGMPEQRPLWQVQSLEPLTLSPSILMDPAKGGCGLHGYIREGRWVSA